jgi:hypothetical protein
MKALTISVLVAAIVTAVTAISILSPAALAQKSQGSNGLEVADQQVHNTPGDFGGQQDVNFHTGICQGGHSTAALDASPFGGCSGLKSPSQLGSGHNGK